MLPAGLLISAALLPPACSRVPRPTLGKGPRAVGVSNAPDVFRVTPPPPPLSSVLLSKITLTPTAGKHASELCTRVGLLGRESARSCKGAARQLLREVERSFGGPWAVPTKTWSVQDVGPVSVPTKPPGREKLGVRHPGPLQEV
eukprot:scaffold503_cov365-Prasinococcus_capsulatus_cf.AAC.15